MMSQRACNLGTEVLDDLISFFECSPEFISVPCEKLRRTQGKQFNNKVVSALMGLRTDLDRNERKQAVQICEEIIKNFRDDKSAQGGKKTKNQGLFSIVEEQDAKAKKAQQKAKEEEKKQGGAQFVLTDSEDMSDDDGLDMSEFMREGGLQEEQEQSRKKKNEEEKKRAAADDEVEEGIVEGLTEPSEADPTAANDKIEGFLFLKKTKLEQNKMMLLNNLPSVATLGNLVGQQRKHYCCIRNGVLYQYDRKTARVNMDRFKLGNVSALDLKSEEK